jgi:nicotinate-nucleotide adenylyltransferase
MSNIILFFGSFDPLHLGHISMMNNAMKKVKGDVIYLGLNKTSKKGKLTPFSIRKTMLTKFCKDKDNIKLLDFYFNYSDMKTTYENIYSLIAPNDNAYILVGADQLCNIKDWYKIDELSSKFKFIVARREGIQCHREDLNNPNYIFINHEYKDISSSLIKRGEYEYTDKSIKEYILATNLYLKEQISMYLSGPRYHHVLAVSDTALLINKEAKLKIKKNKIEKAALLHDIAKHLDEDTCNEIMKNYYSEYIDVNEKIIHQYTGEYIANNHFHINDKDILNSIKYHTTGRANMSTLEKLIYVSDKIEPNRNFDTTELLSLCCKDFERGFIEVLKTNKEYLESKEDITDNDTLNCFKYYLSDK